jgi:chromosome partitioning protein
MRRSNTTMGARLVAKILTIAQQKGGAGKTTLAAHLAVAFARSGCGVAMVDIDPQQSLSMWHRARKEALGDAAAGVDLSTVSGWRARNEIDRLARDYDIVLIDSPPHAETEAKIVVRSADLVVVPVQPSPMDVWATRPTLDLAAQEKVPAMLVLNRVPPRANLTEDMLSEIARLGAHIAKAQIGNRVALAAALAQGKVALETQPSGAAAREVTALAQEILRALK